MARTEEDGFWYEVYPLSRRLSRDKVKETRAAIKSWRKLLMAEFPTCKPVRVYLRGRLISQDDGEVGGLMVDGDDHFKIFLAWSSEWSAIHNAMIEEWTHARCHPNKKHDVQYDLEFGIIQRMHRGE